MKNLSNGNEPITSAVILVCLGITRLADARTCPSQRSVELACVGSVAQQVGSSARYSVDLATPTISAVSATVLSLASYSCRAVASFPGVSYGRRHPYALRRGRQQVRRRAFPMMSRSNLDII
jgi:hypothetical protein